MAKWSGKIGFRIEVEVKPGIWEEQIIEKNYRGDIIRNYRSYDRNTEILDHMSIGNSISIISDPFARGNLDKMIFITYEGTKWKTSSFDIDYPRIDISLGGVYNDENVGNS